MRDVVVTGVGAVTPLGVGARTLHERWSAGACGVRGGEAPCADFTATDHMSAKEARRADRFTQLGVVAAREALADAGWDAEAPYAPDRVGCIVGTGIGGLATLEHGFGVLRDRGPENVSPLAVPLMMGNAGAAALAMEHDLRGPVFGVVSAWAAGAPASRTGARALAGRRSAPRRARSRPAMPTPCSPAAPRLRSRRSRGPPSPRWTRRPRAAS